MRCPVRKSSTCFNLGISALGWQATVVAAESVTRVCVRALYRAHRFATQLTATLVLVVTRGASKKERKACCTEEEEGKNRSETICALLQISVWGRSPEHRQLWLSACARLRCRCFSLCSICSLRRTIHNPLLNLFVSCLSLVTNSTEGVVFTPLSSKPFAYSTIKLPLVSSLSFFLSFLQLAFLSPFHPSSHLTFRFIVHSLTSVVPPPLRMNTANDAIPQAQMFKPVRPMKSRYPHSHGTAANAVNGNVPPRPTSRQVKRILNKEIGLVMLLLAAHTVSEMNGLEDALSTELVAEAYPFADRPSMNDTFSSRSNSIPTTPAAGKCLQLLDLSEGVSSSPSAESDSSDKYDEEAEDEAVMEEVLSQLSTPSARHQFLQDTDAWEIILSYLPWEEVLNVRGVNKFLFRQSLSFVAVTRLPQTKTPAFFIACREDFDENEMEVEAALQLVQAPWSCPNCGLFNDKRPVCSNIRCQAPRPVSGQRMFFGQLRRNGTVPMVRWLVNYVFNAPSGALLCVENHRNSHTHRGKGCAWPTIQHEETVQHLLQAHHRLFFDNFGGVEGVWVVPRGAETALATEVSKRYNGSHQKHMPRGTIVVELPSLATANNNNKEREEPTKDTKTMAGAPNAVGAHADFTHSRTRAANTPNGFAAAPYSAAGYGYAKGNRAAAKLPSYDHYATNATMESQYNHAAFHMFTVTPAITFVRPGVYRNNPYHPIAF